MKKAIIYPILIFFVLLGCKDETIPEPTLLSLIPGKYTFRWSETEPGTNYAITKGGGYDGGLIEISTNANNSIIIKGRSDRDQSFIYFTLFYKEVEPLRFSLYQKNDIRRSGSFWYDKSDKSIIRVAFFISITDSLGRIYDIGGEKLGR